MTTVRLTPVEGHELTERQHQMINALCDLIVDNDLSPDDMLSSGVWLIAHSVVCEHLDGEEREETLKEILDQIRELIIRAQEVLERDHRERHH
jgi:hypothetical protein